MNDKTGNNNSLSSATPGVCGNQRLHALLNRYQDNELNARDHELIRQHLGTCETCRTGYMMLEDLTANIKSLSSIEPVNNFNALLMEKVRDSRKKSLKFFGHEIQTFIYSFVFILFLALGFMVNGMFTTKYETPAGTSEVTQPQEINFTRLLNESHSLSLIDVQDTTLALLNTNDNVTGGIHEQ
jgi:predicted anti-sigma-YlaC factor YlaD